jgi:hypothetical protein
MGLIEQGVGGHQHEMRAINVVGHFSGPYMGCIEKPPGNHLIGDDNCERNHKPHKYLPRPFTDEINSIQKLF